MPVSFDQHCLHITFYPYFSSEFYSGKYEKLPFTVSIKNISEKIVYVSPIPLKQLNSWT